MRNVLPCLKYARLTLVHKWYVFLAGRKTGANLWDLIIHDLSKFTPAELPHYGRQFFGTKDDQQGFMRAWLHHQNVNKHHWQYWIPRDRYNYKWTGDVAPYEPLPMPPRYIKEMLADWLAAGRAYNGKWPTQSDWPWWEAHKDKINIHDFTRGYLTRLIEVTVPLH